ncbi:MAG: transcriptional regulator, partial [Chloroflexi bacterium]
TAGAGGLLANPIPFLSEPGGSALGVLQAHLARANPQWHDLANVEECLVVFRPADAAA